jgi:universal stress protein A
MYQHILLAVDFFEQDSVVINKAKQLAGVFKAKLSVVHVIDSVPLTDVGYGGELPFNLDLTAELMEAAKQRLEKLAIELGIHAEAIFLETGNPKLNIVKVARDNKVDLIIIGSHGRHGLALLLGSTANGVLHHASCDVLAVRLHDN